MHLGEIVFASILAIGSVIALAGLIHFGHFARKIKPKLIVTATIRASEIIGWIDELRSWAPDAPPRRQIAKLRDRLARGGSLDVAFSHGISFSADAVGDAVATYVNQHARGLVICAYIAAFATIIGLAGTVVGVMSIFAAMSKDKADLFAVIGGIGACLRVTCGAMIVASVSGAGVKVARHALADLQTHVRRLVLTVHDIVVDSWPRQANLPPRVFPFRRHQQKLAGSVAVTPVPPTTAPAILGKDCELAATHDQLR